jgi:hypothetical protein
MDEITLQCHDLGARNFPLSQAQRILQIQVRNRIPGKDCWHLLEGSRFEFTDNELRQRKNTRPRKDSASPQGAVEIG